MAAFLFNNKKAKEIENIIDLVDRFYSIFGLSYSFRLGLRPDKFVGESSQWDEAEDKVATFSRINDDLFYVASAGVEQAKAISTVLKRKPQWVDAVAAVLLGDGSGAGIMKWRIF